MKEENRLKLAKILFDWMYGTGTKWEKADKTVQFSYLKRADELIEFFKVNA